MSLLRINKNEENLLRRINNSMFSIINYDWYRILFKRHLIRMHSVLNSCLSFCISKLFWFKSNKGFCLKIISISEISILKSLGLKFMFRESMHKLLCKERFRIYCYGSWFWFKIFCSLTLYCYMRIKYGEEYCIVGIVLLLDYYLRLSWIIIYLLLLLL